MGTGKFFALIANAVKNKKANVYAKPVQIQNAAIL